MPQDAQDSLFSLSFKVNILYLFLTSPYRFQTPLLQVLIGNWKFGRWRKREKLHQYFASDSHIYTHSFWSFQHYCLTALHNNACSIECSIVVNY